MQNLAHSLLFIQNSKSLAIEKRDEEAVIAVKPAIPQETVKQEHDAKPEFVTQKNEGKWQ
jgi:hypothetical protein